ARPADARSTRRGDRVLRARPMKAAPLVIAGCPRSGLRAIVIGALALAGCDPVTARPDAGPSQDAGASPNASILPAPLATESPEVDAAGVDSGPQGMLADSAGRLYVPDASAPPPEVLRPDLAMPADPTPAKDPSGVALEGAWRWRDVPGPPKAPEVSLEAIK